MKRNLPYPKNNQIGKECIEWLKRNFKAIICIMDWTITIGTLTFGTLDIIVLAILLISAISGCIVGFARQFAHLAGFLVSIPVSLLLTRPFASLLIANSTIPPFWATMIVFVAIALIVYALIRIFGGMLENVLELIPALNHILGFVWGLVSAAVVLSIILAVLNYQTFFDFESFFASSIIIERIIEPLFPGIVGVIADVV